MLVTQAVSQAARELTEEAICIFIADGVIYQSKTVEPDGEQTEVLARPAATSGRLVQQAAKFLAIRQPCKTIDAGCFCPFAFCGRGGRIQFVQLSMGVSQLSERLMRFYRPDDAPCNEAPVVGSSYNVGDFGFRCNIDIGITAAKRDQGNVITMRRAQLSQQ